jgi:hypothetical protein
MPYGNPSPELIFTMVNWLSTFLFVSPHSNRTLSMCLLTQSEILSHLSLNSSPTLSTMALTEGFQHGFYADSTVCISSLDFVFFLSYRY